MSIKTIYLAFCGIGVVLPYWEFVPWITAHGLNVPLLVQQLFANRISGFFGLDVIVSSLVLLVFMRAEAVRVGNIRGPWLPVIALLVVGVSLALPLFLYLRELALENGRRVQAVKA